MKTRLIALLLAVLTLLAAMTAVYASEDPEQTQASEEMQASGDTQVPEESLVPEQTPVPEEVVAEAAQAETQTETETPVSDDPYPDADHDDPMYWEMVERLNEPTTDGASYSSFTPRALNNETLWYGIDISNWQGDINWSKVAASGVQFVIIRGAYRGVSSGVIGTDSRFYSYVSGAKAAGLLVGVYIYSQAITVQEGIEEANYLIRICSGLSIDLPLVIDYEYYGTSGRLYNAHLSRQTATDICNAFCRTAEAAGYDSMVYGNPSMLNSSLYREQLGRVWLAHFTTKTSYSGSYEYWQPGVGTISGISGSTDLDFWFRPNDWGTTATSTPTPTSAPAADNSTEEPQSSTPPSATDDPDPTATPEATPVGDTPFTDVPKGEWFYETVLSAYKQGIVNGLSATQFGPNETTTRGQAITMIYRMVGEPTPTAAAAFADLTQDYYKNAVAWGVENGVVKGVSDTAFSPDANITRQDLAVLLYRLSGEPAQEGELTGFTDADDVRDYAQQAMLWAVNSGIITGFDDGTLQPGANATRAQVCTMLMRLQELNWAK